MKLDQEAIRRLDRKLLERSRRLVKLVELGAPVVIVEGALRLVLQAGLGRYSDLANNIFYDMSRKVQTLLGVCACGAAIAEPTHSVTWPECCPTCQARQDEEDERAAVDALRDEELDAEEL